MESGIFSEGKEYISASRVSKQVGYSSDYLGQLCRAKKLPGKLIGRTWYIDLQSAIEYKQVQQLAKKKNFSKNAEVKSAPISSPTPVELPVLSAPFLLEESSVSFESDSQPLLPELLKTVSPVQKFSWKLVSEVAAVTLSLVAVVGFTFGTLDRAAPALSRSLQENIATFADNAVTFADGMVHEASGSQVAALSLFGALSDSLEFIADGFRNLRSVALGTSTAEKTSTGAQVTFVTAPVEAPASQVATKPLVQALAQTAPRITPTSYAGNLKGELQEYIRNQISAATIERVVYNNTVLREQILLSDTRPTVTRQSDADSDHLAHAILDLTEGGRFFDPTITGATITGPLGSFVNLGFNVATGTSATTTNFYSEVASSTHFFSTNANIGFASLGNATSTNLFSTTASSTNLFSTFGSFAFATFGHSTTTNATSTTSFATTASSTDLFSTNATLAYALFGNTTTTNATTTSLFSTTASSTNLFSTNANFGYVLLGHSTTTNATSTNAFATTASSTNLFSTNFNLGVGVLGNATSSNLFSTTASSTNLFSTNANFGYVLLGRSTTTNATTTTLFSTTASSTNLFSSIASIGDLSANTLTVGSISGGLTTLSNLLVNGSSTLQNFTFVNATGTSATTTNFFSTKGTFDELYVNNYQQNDGTFAIISTVATGNIFSVTDSAVTSGALIRQTLTANAGNGQVSRGQIIDLTDATVAGGGYSALEINTSGAGVGSGSKTLLSLNPGATNGVVFDTTGSFRPTTDASVNTNSLGSASYYWKNGYFDTLTANNLSGTVVTGSTSNDTWTIGSTEAGDDLKSIIFQRNSGSGNATFNWNSGAADLRYLSVNYPFNSTYTVNDASIGTAVNLYSGALTNNTTGGTQTLLSLSNTGTGTTERGIYLNNSGVGTTGLEIAGTWTNGILTNNNTINTGSGNITTTGTVSTGNLALTGSTTLQNFTFVNATGTSATTTNFFSSTASSTNLFSTNANFGYVLLGRSTTTNATSTTLFATTASSTDLFSTNANFGYVLLGNSSTTNATTTTLFSTTASSTNLFASNATIGTISLSNLALTGSTTLQNFTFVNATGTSATTTNFFATKLAGTNILAGDGDTTTASFGFASDPDTGLRRLAAGRVAVMLDGVSTYDINSNRTVFGTDSTHQFQLNYQTDNTATFLSRAGTDAAIVKSNQLWATGSSTLQNFTFVNATGTSATTTSFFASTASSTNLYSSLATIGTSLTIGTSPSLTISPTELNVTTNNGLVFSTNNTNRWQIQNTGHLIAVTDNTYDIGASGATRPRNVYVGTSVVSPNFLATGSSTLQNFTFVNATGTSATTTSFFSTTASSTNLFSSVAAIGGTQGLNVVANGNIGIGTTGNNLVYTGSSTITPKVVIDSGSGVDSLALYSTNTTNGAYLNFATDNSAAARFRYSAISGAPSDTTAGSEDGVIRFLTATAGANITEKMRLGSTGGLSLGSAYVTTDPGAGNFIASGNVGVGTTNPGAPLQVNLASDGLVAILGSGGATNPQLRLSGGQNFDIVNVGSTRVGFEIADSEKLSILSGGNVGIGTTNPEALLHVAKSSSTGAIESSAGLTVGTTNTRLLIGADGTNNVSYLQAVNPGVNYNRPLALNPSGGNVGIGTTVPGTLLQVGGTSNFQVGADFTGSVFGGGSRPAFQLTDGTVKLYSQISGRAYFGTLSNHTLTLQTNGTNRAALSAAGGFSLGTNYNGNDAGVNNMLIEGSLAVGSTSPLAQFVASSTSAIAGIFDQRGTSDILQLQDSGATVFTVKDGGNVGIGTTNPSTKLHVVDGAGEFKFQNVSQSNLYLSGTNASFIIDTTSGSYPSVYLKRSGSIDAQITNINGGAGLALYGDGSGGNTGLFVKAGGNVGIGTTNPANILDVQAASVDARFTATTGTNATYATFRNTGGRAYVGAERSTGGDTSTGSLPYAAVLGTSGANAAQLFTNSIVRLTVDSAGNVGIGTTSPAALLHLSSAAPALRLTNTTAEDTLNGRAVTLDFYGTKADSTSINQGQIKVLHPSSSNDGRGDMLFSVSNNAGTLTERMRLLQDGQINLGTATNASQVNFKGPGGNGWILVDSSTGLLQIGTASTNDIQFQSNNGSTAIMTLLDGGNVGIGTTNPGDRLQVSGGGITLDDNQNINWGDTGTAIDGSAASDFLRFFTSSTEKVRIDSAGNLGIGTTTPQAILHANSASAGIVQLVTTATTGSVYTQYQNVDTGFNSTSDGLTVGYNAGAFVLNRESSPLYFGTADTVRWNINASGHLMAFADNTYDIGASAATRPRTGYFGTGLAVGTGNTWVSNNLTLASGGQAAASHFTAYATGDFQWVGRATIKSPADGVISLGPNAATTGIRADASVDGVLSFQSFAGADTAIVKANQFQTTGSTTLQNFTFVNATGTAATTTSFFSTTASSTNIFSSVAAIGGSAFNVIASGNVGIGTTNPATKLDVWGTTSNGIRTTLAANSAYHADLYETSSGYSVLETSGSGNHLVLSPAGNVGIGTTAPVSKVDIQSARAAQLTNLTLSAASAGSATGDEVSIDFKWQNTYAMGRISGYGQSNALGTGGLKFYTSNQAGSSYNTTPTMTLDKDGNVGIGTTGPTAKLEVNGGGYDTSIYVNTSNTVGAGITLNDTDTGGRKYTIFSSGSAAGAAAGKLSFYDSSTSVTGDRNRMVIDSAGNVGIGTTNPSNKLQVYAPTGNVFSALTTGNTSRAQFTAGNDTNTAYFGVESTAGATFTNTSATSALFGSNGAYSAHIITNGAVALTALSGGSIGIGTTNPGKKLDVSGDARLIGGGNFILGDTTTNGSPSIQFLGTNAATNWRIRQNDQQGGDLTITPSTASGGSTFTTPALSILSAGNVGIGTTNPGYKLEVNGTSGFTGNMVFTADNTYDIGATGATRPRIVNVGTTVRTPYLSTTDSGNTKTVLTMTSGGSQYGTLQVEGNGGTGAWSLGYQSSAGATIGTAALTWTGSGLVGVGTTTPFAKLAVNPVAGDTNQLVVGSSTRTSFIINPAGNVGIGTTSPDTLLTVAGNTKATGSSHLFGSTGVISLFPDASGTNSFIRLANSTKNWELYSGVDGASGIGIYDRTASKTPFLITSSRDIGLGDNVASTLSGANLVVKATGNVGIGTTDPSAPLQVVAAGNTTADFRGPSGRIQIVSSTGTNAAMTFLSNTGGSYYMGAENSAGNGLISTGGIAYSLALVSGATQAIQFAPAGTAQMTLLSGGNVGIGSTAPGNTLVVRQAAASATGLTLSNTNGSGTSNIFFNYNTVDGLGSANLGRIWATAAGNELFVGTGQNGGSTADIVFKSSVGSAGSYDTEIARFTRAGNMGIGVTNPAAKLDVRDGNLIVTDADVAHGITDILPTAAFGGLTVSHATNGGLDLNGISDTNTGLSLYGTMGDTDPTDTIPALLLAGMKKSGTGRAALGAAETVFQVRNFSTNLITGLGSGNIGIGTTNPLYKLEVAGTSSFTTSVKTPYIDLVGAGNTVTNISFNSNGTKYGTIQTEANTGTGAWSLGHQSTNSTTIGTSVLTWTGSGNVGVGSTSPNFLLTVGTGSTGQLGVPTTGSLAAPQIQFGYNTGGVVGLYSDTGNVLRVAIAGQRVASFTATGLQLLAGTTAATGPSLSIDTAGTTGLFSPAAATIGFATGGVEAARLTSGGFLGVSTTTPWARLSVGAHNQALTSPLFVVASSSDAVATTTHLIVTGAGNVGVGTSTPVTTLAVVGSTYTTGGLGVGGLNTTAGTANVYSTNQAKVQAFSSGSTGYGSIAAFNDQNDYIEMSMLGSAYAGLGGSMARVGEISVGTGRALALFTNASTEVMRLTSGGNVGIGTTNPANILDIASGNGKVSVTSTTGTNATWASFTNTGGTLTVGRANSTGSNFSGGIGYASIFHSTGAYPIQFFTNNAPVAIIDSTGNVGIGTTNPTTKLYVAGTTGINSTDAAAFSVSRAVALTNPIFLVNAGTDNAVTGVSVTGAAAGSKVALAAISSGTNEDFKIDAKGSGNILFQTTATGNVGIGTTTPATTFSVNGNGYVTGNFGIGKTPVGGGKLEIMQTTETNASNGLAIFRSSNDSQLWQGWNTAADAWQIAASFSSTGAYKPISFWTSGGEKMRIDTAGNVGIGLTNPSSIFTVKTTNTDVYSGTNSATWDSAVTLSQGTATAGYSTLINFQNPSNLNAVFGAVQNTGGYGDFVFAGYDGSFAERMRLTASGSLGIGTTSPQAEIHISSAAPQLNFTESGASSNNKVWEFRATGEQFSGVTMTDAFGGSNPWIAVDRTGTTIDSVVFPQGSFGIGTTTPFGLFSLEQGTETNSLWIANTGSTTPSLVVKGVNGNGNIGIGTTNPARKFDVWASTMDGIRLTRSDSSSIYGDLLIDNRYNENGISLDVAGFKGIFVSAADGNTIIGSVPAGPGGATGSSLSVPSNMTVGYAPSTVAPTSGLLVGGNVGIGTTTPATKLDVYSTAAEAGAFTSTVTSGTGDSATVVIKGVGTNIIPAIALRATGASGEIYTDYISSAPNVGIIVGGAGSATVFDVRNGNSGPGTGSSIFRVTSANVGIGTTTPFAKFAINPVAGDTNQFVVGSSTATSFIINPAGNVGIGTASPLANLHVKGSTGIRIDDSVGADPTLGFYNGSTRYANLDSSATKFSIVGDTNVGLDFYAGGSDTAHRWMTILTGGNVGIGTTNPGALLDLAGGDIRVRGAGASSSYALKFTQGTTNGTTNAFDMGVATGDFTLNETGVAARLTIKGTTGYTGISSTTPFAKLAVNPVAGDVNQFVVGSSTATSFIINPAGNIGIGTAAPVQKLDVQGAASTNAYVRVAGGAGSTKGGVLLGNAGTVYGELNFDNGTNTVNLTHQYSSGGLTFGTNNTERARFDASGNFGIGSTTPSARLAVNPVAGDTNQFVVGSSTRTSFIINPAGNVGIGTANPGFGLDVAGTSRFTGTITGSADITFKTTSGNKFNVTASDDSSSFAVLNTGRVGIGTTTPNSILAVRSGNASTVVNTGVAQFGVTPGSSSAGIELGTYTGGYGMIQGMAFTTGAANAIVINPFGGNTSLNLGGGNVGIGVTQANTKLQIHDSGTSGLAIQLTDADTGTASADGTQLRLNTGEDFLIHNQENTAVRVFTNDTERFAILASGNVGIGATSPQHSLTLSTTSAPSIGFAQTTGGYTFSNESTGGLARIAAQDLSGSNLWAGAALVFQTHHTEVSALSNSMVIRAGNVGIGLTTPTNKLSVINTATAAAINTAPVLRLQNSQGAGNFTSMHLGGSNQDAYIGFLDDSSAATNRMDFAVSGSTADMTILGNGNVGIGTTAPATTLSVVGTATISSTSILGSTVTLGSSTNGGTLDWDGSNFMVTAKSSKGLYLGANASSAGNLVITTGGLVGIASTTPFAKLAVNPVAGDTNQFVVGSSTATSLIINPAGNVGVGTASPTANLHIAGANQAVKVGDSGSATLYMSGTSNYIAMQSSQFNFTTNQSNGFTFLGGNVGIGTTTPTSVLMTRTATGVNNIFKMDTVDAVGSRGNYISFMFGGVERGYAGYSSTGSSVFSVNNSSGSVALQQAGGNVGIGTTNPGSILDIATSSNSTQVVNIRNTTAGAAALTGYHIGTDETAVTAAMVSTGSAYNTAIANPYDPINVANAFNLIGARGGGMNLIASNGAMKFFAGNATSERMRIDSAGNVGIGTTNPGVLFDVTSTAVTAARFNVDSSAAYTTSSAVRGLTINNVNTAAAGFGGIAFIPSSAGSTAAASIGSVRTGNNTTDLVFAGGSGTESFRITSVGNVGVGITNPDSSLHVGSVASPASGIKTIADPNSKVALYVGSASDAAGGVFVTFRNASAAEQGSITASNSATTAYNTSSDARLKLDLGVATDTDVLKNTLIHNFTWRTNGQQALGVFAQEAYLVNPAAITIGSDEVDSQGRLIRPWSVDYSKYVPNLIVGWQDHEMTLTDMALNLNALASTTATSTPESESFVTSFFDNLFTKVTTWLATAGNGIQDLFATRVRTKELCLSDESGETCITKAMLDALIANVGSSVGGGSTSGGSTGGDTGGDTGGQTGGDVSGGGEGSGETGGEEVGGTTGGETGGEEVGGGETTGGEETGGDEVASGGETGGEETNP